MANSLRDALTKAGVVSSAQAKVAAQQAKKQQRQEIHAQRSGAPVLNDAAIAVQNAQQEKVLRDQELNRAQEIERQAKAARAQVRQILRANMQNDEAAQVKFNFVAGKQIRHIYLTDIQRAQLINGQLSLVAFSERHYLVTREIANKVQILIPDIFIYSPSAERNSMAPDDPYADYSIPDDLIW